MQIEIYNPKNEPLQPVQWNYKELKEQLITSLNAYKGRVYTDETISDAKKDRANLNKLADAIDNRRKELKSLYLAPYQEFEVKAKELINLVKNQSKEIDEQVKEYDKQRKLKKKKKIKARYLEIMGNLAELVPYSKIHNSKWLNVTYSMSNIDLEIAEKAEKIKTSLETINNLNLQQEISEEIKRIYLDKLDLSYALDAKKRIELERKQLAQYEAEKEEKPQEKTAETTVQEIEPPKQENQPVYTVDFRVIATAEQLNELKNWLRTNNVNYGPVNG